MSEIATLVSTCPAWLDFEQRTFNPAFSEGLRLAFHASNLPGDEFLDKAARYVAHEFSTGRITFEQADGAVNDLWVIWTEIDSFDPALGAYVLPDGPFYAIYEAFDTGEMYGGDRTREILAEQGLDQPSSEGAA
ncbi:MAG TPA: hypothetical protein VGB53_08465 [Rubricoccaceae bacterium]|jgi:hypothetical protein